MKRFCILFFAFVTMVNALMAREVISINDSWRFYFSAENSADYARSISLPHTWNYDTSNMLISSQPTVANYIKDLHIPAEWGRKRVFIKFYGVQSIADIMVNGRYLGEHRGGSTAFTFELTEVLRAGESNRIHVIVNSTLQRDILPTSHEQNIYGGIYRDVEIIVTDKMAVSPLYYGSDGIFVDTESVSEESVSGNVRVHLSSTSTSMGQLVLSIADAAGEVVFQKIQSKVKISSAPVTIPFSIDGAKLWSTDDPNLYSFSVRVGDDSNEDMVTVKSGFRSVQVSPSGPIKINGEPVQFRGVSLYHDYPHVGGAAQRRDIESDMEIIEELGVNAIRSVSYPHHPYLYELCDEAGKMVWIDFPLVKAPYLSDLGYFPTARFHAQGRETLHEIIAQNYNHPSVVMWGIFSLLSTRGDSPVPYIKELNTLAKELDSTRPTVAVSDQDGDINSITDLMVWNQSLGWDNGLFSDIDIWRDILHTRWGALRSAVVYGQNGRIDQQSVPDKYKSKNQYSADAWKPEGRQRIFHEEYAKRAAADSLFWGVCLNSMFDFKSSRNSLGENNMGLVTFDRRSRKDIFYLYKAMWNHEEPTLHIADSRSSVTQSPLHKVTVYSSEAAAPVLTYSAGELSDSVTMKQVAPAQFVADSVLLHVGVNKIVVRQGKLSDSTDIILEKYSR